MRVPEFHVGTNTHVVGGSGVADRVGRYAAGYGRRALIVLGQSHARASGLLGRVEHRLREEGLAVDMIEGVGPNPNVTLVDAGATLARSWHADVIVAVGGGSVIDVAKAIATSAAAAEVTEFRTHLSGLRSPGHMVDAVTPVVAVPTLPGSGSETNGTSVLIDSITGRKLSAHSDLAAPRIALLDPELVSETTQAQLAPGLADAVCHALEAALSSRATVASDALAEQALRTVLRHGAPALDRRSQTWHEDMLRVWWATELAGQALTLAGSLVTHPLAHALSARFDASHGAAVAALEPAVLARFSEAFAASGALARVARWLEVRTPDDEDTALRGILGRLARFHAALGVRDTVTDLGLTTETFPDVVRDARESGSRGLGTIPGGVLDVDQLFSVLDLAMTCGPTTSAKQVQQRRDEIRRAVAVDG